MRPWNMERDALATDKSEFIDIMKTVLAPDDLGDYNHNSAGAALRTAIIYAAAAKYASQVTASQKGDLERLQLGIDSMFSVAKILIVAGSTVAGPGAAPVAGIATADTITGAGKIVNYVVSQKISFTPANIAPEIAIHLRRNITNLASAGICVPCMIDRDLTNPRNQAESDEKNMRAKFGSQFVKQMADEFSTLTGAPIELINSNINELPFVMASASTTQVAVPVAAPAVRS
jgi:hypothetical protein